MKKLSGSLMGIAINLQITLGSMAIFMMLIVGIHEHGIFFYLFVSSHFFEQWFVVLEEVLLISCKLYPWYFILFIAVVNGSLLLIWIFAIFGV